MVTTRGSSTNNRAATRGSSAKKRAAAVMEVQDQLKLNSTPKRTKLRSSGLRFQESPLTYVRNNTRASAKSSTLKPLRAVPCTDKKEERMERSPGTNEENGVDAIGQMLPVSNMIQALRAVPCTDTKEERNECSHATDEANGVDAIGQMLHQVAAQDGSGTPIEPLHCPTLSVIAPASIHGADRIPSPAASNDTDKGPELSSSDCLLGNSHVQQTTSFNLTELADQMASDDFDEVNSLGGDTSRVYVGGYSVQPNHADLVRHILATHGDIAANCCLKKVGFRSALLDILCDQLQKKAMVFLDITKPALQEMLSYADEFGNIGVEIGWFKKRLDQICKAKEAVDFLRIAKKQQVKLKCKLLDMKGQEKACARELAVKEAEMEENERMKKAETEEIERKFSRELAMKKAEMEDIERKYLSVSSAIPMEKLEVQKMDKLITESKDVLGYVVALKSLADGLIEEH